MKKLLLIGAGVALGYMLFSSRSIWRTVRLGEKGREIEGLQKSIERLTGIQFEEYGVYDKETQKAVRFLMTGTNAMKNNRGDLDPEFVSDMSKIYDNSLNKIS